MAWSGHGFGFLQMVWPWSQKRAQRTTLLSTNTLQDRNKFLGMHTQFIDILSRADLENLSETFFDAARLDVRG